MYNKRNKVKSKLEEGTVALGTWVQMASPEIVEAVGYQGYDFVIIDMEHGQFDIETAPAMVRAAEASGVSPFLRVPKNEETTILKALDTGAMGVIVPGISTKEQAEKAVRAAKYGPIGVRGACPWTRSTQYNSLDWTAHVKWSNEETMVWLLIEGKEGVDNFDEILTVPNIGAIMFGPFDLSQSLGIPGELDHPLLLETLKNMVQKANQNNVPVVAVMLSEITPEQIQKSTRKWQELGCQIITVGGDRAIICTGFKNALENAQEALKK